MFPALLKKLGYNELQQQALLSILYIIHCYENHLEFHTTNKQKWLDSMVFKNIEECYDWLNKFCQSRMLRPKNTERLQLIPSGYIGQYFHTLIKYIKRLNLIGEIRPKYKEYDAILFLGASQGSMESRTKTVVELLHHGLKADALYVLSGDRDLWPKHETLTPITVTEKIAKKTEASGPEVISIYRKICHKINKMLPEEKFLTNSSAEINAIREEIKSFFEHSLEEKSDYPRIQWPNELDLAKILLKNYMVPDIINTTYINAPKNKSGGRPNTLDTVVYFEKEYKAIKKSSHKPKLLVISGQPFIEYQTVIVKSILSEKDYYIEGVGKGEVATDERAIAVCLDSIARSIYASEKIIKNSL